MAKERLLCDTTCMAFIRKRITKIGAVSTALGESYRDGGKVRHRLIANLHGAETLAIALGRLAAERDRLRKERAAQEPDLESARQFHKMVFLAGVAGDRYGDFDMEKTTPQKVEQCYKKAEQILKRVAEIDSRLDKIQKEGAAIKKHCTASPDEIRAEAEKHAKYLHELECLELGLAYGGRGKSIKAQAKAMLEMRDGKAAHGEG